MENAQEKKHIKIFVDKSNQATVISIVRQSKAQASGA